ncbi:hypothetical protein [Schaalia sp. Marseille-Q2122]|nr:hypothetical protein [Schaalia sp. Marseille-Q2122]
MNTTYASGLAHEAGRVFAWWKSVTGVPVAIPLTIVEADAVAEACAKAE